MADSMKPGSASRDGAESAESDPFNSDHSASAQYNDESTVPFDMDKFPECSGLRRELENQQAITTDVSCPKCHNKDIENFDAVQEAQHSEAWPTVYTCISCGEVFRINYQLLIDSKTIESVSQKKEHAATKRAAQTAHKDNDMEVVARNKSFPENQGEQEQQYGLKCENCHNEDINRYEVQPTCNGVVRIKCRVCQQVTIVSEERLKNYEGPASGINDTPSTQCQQCLNNIAERFDETKLATDGTIICLVCQTILTREQQQQQINSRNSCGPCGNLSKQLKSRPVGDLRQEIVDNIGLLSPGDHVKWQRDLFYYHHAIVDSVDQRDETCEVIQYTNGPKINGSLIAVRRSKLRLVDHYRAMYRVHYEPGECFSVERTLELARSSLDEGNYNAFTNNCEHFTTWCKTGRRVCGQVSTLVNRLERAAGSSTLKAGEIGLLRALKAILRSISKAPSVTAAGDAIENGVVAGAETAVTQTIAATGDAVQEVAAATAGLSTKALRNMRYAKIGATTVNVVVNIGVEAGFFTYYAYKAYCQYDTKKISWHHFKRELLKLGGESIGGVVGGIVGGIFGGMFAPCPVVGAIVGGTLGNIIGRFIGTLIFKIFSDFNSTWKRIGHLNIFLHLPTAIMYDARSAIDQNATRLQCSNCLNGVMKRFQETSADTKQCLVCGHHLPKPATNRQSEKESNQICAANQSKRFIKCSQCGNGVTGRFSEAKFEVGKKPSIECRVCQTILRIQLSEDPTAMIVNVSIDVDAKFFDVTLDSNPPSSAIACKECGNNIVEKFADGKCLVCSRSVCYPEEVNARGEINAYNKLPAKALDHNIRCSRCYNNIADRFRNAGSDTGRKQCLVCSAFVNIATGQP